MMLKVLAMAIFLPVAAFGCEAKLHSVYNRAIDLSAPDQALINKAVLAFVNLERCRKKLPEMVTSASLLRVAVGHAQDMAAKRYFSHKSPTAGRRTLKQRMKAGRLRYTRAAENIAKRNAFAFGGQKFQIRDAAACHFVNDATKKRVPVHGYASLAQAAVRGWMASKGHRRNILDPKLAITATGIAVDASAPHCGSILLTQNFMG